MGFRVTVRSVMLTAMVLGVASSATAQPAASNQPAVPAPPSNGQVGFERRPTLSPQEELVQADTMIAKMDQASATVRHQLDAARQGRDVVRSLCLSDKLSQVDVSVRSARDRQVALQAAAQRNDTELANHEFTILTVLRERAEQLSAEANQCIGEEVAFVGQTQVVTAVDPNLPGEETATYPPPTDVPSPPPPVSATQ